MTGPERKSMHAKRIQRSNGVADGACGCRGFLRLPGALALHKRSLTTQRCVAAVAFLGLTCAPLIAKADDLIAISITNDGVDPVVVTVYDLNTKPRGTILSAERISGFASVVVSATLGRDGMGAVSWRARGVDSRYLQCGRGTLRGLGDAAVVNIHVDEDCGLTDRNRTFDKVAPRVALCSVR